MGDLPGSPGVAPFLVCITISSFKLEFCPLTFTSGVHRVYIEKAPEAFCTHDAAHQGVPRGVHRGAHARQTERTEPTRSMHPSTLEVLRTHWGAHQDALRAVHQGAHGGRA
jgi:hypothetical protein